MKDALEIINQMQADGVIGKYAIGGAVGAAFYIETVATLDIDVFINFQGNAGLISLTPIYDYLQARGCKIKGEYILIGSWQVQFLPPGSALEEEAINDAIQTQVEDGIPTQVMSAEHLVAIALKLGREKDFIRIHQFIKSGILNRSKIDAIMSRHGLIEKWKKFNDAYLKNE